MEAFLPPAGLLFWFTAYKLSDWENSRWIRARQDGLIGRVDTHGLFIDLTGFVTLIFGIAWIVAYGYDVGWQPAVGLYAVVYLAMVVISILQELVVAAMRRPSLEASEWPLWIFGTVAVWPLMAVLVFRVSWFGLVS